MMHIYKRDLTPIKDCFQQVNTMSPYMNNQEVFESNLVQSRFNQDYLNDHQDVQVTSKSKNFTTYSLVFKRQSVSCNKDDILNISKINLKKAVSTNSAITSSHLDNTLTLTDLKQQSQYNDSPLKRRLKANIQKLKDHKQLISSDRKQDSEQDLSILSSKKNTQDFFFKRNLVRNQRLVLGYQEKDQKNSQFQGSSLIQASIKSLSKAKKKAEKFRNQSMNIQNLKMFNKQEKEESLYLYNPSDTIPLDKKPLFENKAYEGIFDYKVPLREQLSNHQLLNKTAILHQPFKLLKI